MYLNAELAKQNNAREEKWRELLTENSLTRDPNLLKKRLRKGVPQSLRIIVWPMLIRMDKHIQNKKFKYESLLQISSPYDREIGLDINRNNVEERPAIMRKSLSNVLHALSLAYPKIGYCQAMNTLVMRLL